MRISDWSSDVCSSDLRAHDRHQCIELAIGVTVGEEEPEHDQGGDGGLHEASDVRRPVLLMRGTQGSTETGDEVLAPDQIGRAHVCTPVTNAQLVCRLLLEKKKTNKQTTRTKTDT